jgi:LPXTG-motif cell wall-anchored protein
MWFISKIPLANILAIAGNVNGESSNLNLVIIGLVVVIVILIVVTLFANKK